MKKKLFIALSAVSIVIVGCLAVACSSDSNTPDAVPQKIVQKSAPEQSDDANWADFYAEVEALNAKYGMRSRNLPMGELIPDTSSIPNRDIIGGLYGAEIISNLPNGSTISIPGIVLPATIYSFYAFKETLDSPNGSTVTLRSISTIVTLRSNNPAAIIGQQHNRILSEMINSDLDVLNMTYPQLIQAFINKYELLYSSIPFDVEREILSLVLNRTPSLSSNVQQANSQFRVATASMTMLTKRNYTDEYLNVVEASQVDAYDKLQMAIYAGISYYSGALWIVE